MPRMTPFMTPTKWSEGPKSVVKVTMARRANVPPGLKVEKSERTANYRKGPKLSSRRAGGAQADSGSVPHSGIEARSLSAIAVSGNLRLRAICPVCRLHRQVTADVRGGAARRWDSFHVRDHSGVDRFGQHYGAYRG